MNSIQLIFSDEQVIHEIPNEVGIHEFEDENDVIWGKGWAVFNGTKVMCLAAPPKMAFKDELLKDAEQMGVSVDNGVAIIR